MKAVKRKAEISISHIDKRICLKPPLCAIVWPTLKHCRTAWGSKVWAASCVVSKIKCRQATHMHTLRWLRLRWFLFLICLRVFHENIPHKALLALWRWSLFLSKYNVCYVSLQHTVDSRNPVVGVPNVWVKTLNSQTCLAHGATSSDPPPSCSGHPGPLIILLMQEWCYYTSARIIGLHQTIGKDAWRRLKVETKIMLP